MEKNAMSPKLTTEIITAAIDGFEAQKTRIDAQIAELRALLPGGSTKPAAAETTEPMPQRKRRKFSPDAIRRMREAQQRRWAKVRGESEAPAPVTAPAPAKAKRKLSAAGRAAIDAATKKRWAAIQKAEKPATKTAPAKKKMSPARKAALVANLAKARAARAAKRGAESTKGCCQKGVTKGFISKGGEESIARQESGGKEGCERQYTGCDANCRLAEGNGAGSLSPIPAHNPELDSADA
jgi:hypothetical protein